MSLILTSSIKSLDAYLRQFDGDDATSPVELQTIRDDADAHVRSVTGVAAETKAEVDARVKAAAEAKAKAEAMTPLDRAVTDLLGQADAIVEGMQRVSLEARRAKLPQEKRDALKEAIEHQIGYVVAGYQSSIQRL